MHYNNSIVTILDAKTKNQFREYDHIRQGNLSQVTVRVPFGSEYLFRFKFPDQKRRRLEISIDGTLVTDNLIITDGSELERFVESDKRFKFVEASNDAVSDPGSPSNGKIEIKLFEESLPITHLTKTWNDNVIYRPIKGYPGPGCEITCSSYSSDMNLNVYNTSSCNASNVLRSMASNDIGATVEGSRSKQEFGSTTWQGDSFCSTFIFWMKGKQNDTKEDKFCSSCGNSIRSAADRFCSKCGNKISRT